MIFLNMKVRLFEVNNVVYVAISEHDFLREGLAKSWDEIKEQTENFFDGYNNRIPAKMKPIPVALTDDETDFSKIVAFCREDDSNEN